MFGRPGIPSVQPREVAADAFLLDVREDDEWRAGHVDGARHVPLMELQARVGELPQGAPITVVCRVGGRSAQATAWLVQQGYDAVNLDGGLVAWASDGRALVCDADNGTDPFVL